MNISISSKLLYDNLSKIQGVVGTNSVINIIDNFLFVIENNTLKAVATDLENMMSVSIPVEADGKLSIAIPAKRLMDNLKYIPEQPIMLKINEEKLSFEIQTSKGNYKFTGYKAADFPLMEDLKDATTFTVESELLTSVINHTTFAMSNDESRKVMTGLFCEFTDNGINFVSTDAQKLVKYSRRDMKVDGAKNIIIPKKSLNQIKNSINENADNVVVRFDENHCCFEFDNTQLTSRLIIEGQFPDYNAAITDNNPNILKLEKNEIVSALRRLTPFTSKTTNQVIFDIQGGKLGISATDVDYDSQGSEELVVDYTGEDMKIAFNSKYLLEVLMTVESSNLIIEMSTPQRAALIFPSEMGDNATILMLIMPITTQV